MNLVVDLLCAKSLNAFFWAPTSWRVMMLDVMDVGAVLSLFWSLSRVHEVNNAMLSGVWLQGPVCASCCHSSGQSTLKLLSPCHLAVSLETQYINYIRRYRSIFLTEWCVSITITELFRLAGMLWMLQVHFCPFYVEQMQWVRQEGLSQTIQHISEEPAADG